MNWMRMSKPEANEIMNYLLKMSSLDFLNEIERWSDDDDSELPREYRDLRKFIHEKSRELTHSTNITDAKWTYDSDLKFGLSLYEYTVNEMNMSPAIASENEIWIYIQMKVVPGMVYRRWVDSADNGRINAKRFWSDGARLWLKSLWWYVYLSLQHDSLEETYNILKNNGSDDINQLLDRTGNGYRVDLCRSIMKRYGNTSEHRNNLLKKILKLNVLNCATVEPALCDGGVDEYTESLFGYYGA